MHKQVLLPLLLCMILSAGCSHPASVVGTWAGTQTSPNGVLLKITWAFTADGKNMTTMQPTGGYYNGITLNSSRTYKADGGAMTQTIASMNEPGRARTVTNPVTSTYQYTLSGDTLTINGRGFSSTLVLTRQSS